MASYTAIGRPVVHGEGQQKVSGSSLYGVDVTRPGMLWGKPLRSPHPHARIVNIDTSRAKRLPGVHAVITGKDLPRARIGRVLRDHPVLAHEKALFVGDKVAAIAAESPDITEEALTLIEVEYEELPAVFDPLEAMKPGAPILHPDVPSYDGLLEPLPQPTNDFCRVVWSKGDVAHGLAESDLIFEHTFTTQLMHQVYLEPHACVVEIDTSGRVQIWANNKAPFLLRRQLAAVTGLPEDRILMNPCFIGGDFGGKGDFMDVPLCYHLARVSGKPVKMAMDYVEELMAGNPRHPSLIRIKSGLKKDGTLWAREAWLVFDAGAYGGFTPVFFLAGSHHAAGCYRIPHVQIESHRVYTNNVPRGHMRAPGEPQAIFAVERHTDMIARELGRDPYEFRLQNVLKDGDANPLGERYTEIRAEETLRKAAEAFGWGQPRVRPTVGLGISLDHRAPGGYGDAEDIVTIDARGRVTLGTPIWDTGTGAQTILRQIVAEELTIPVEEVALDVLNTDGVAFDTGIGGSRGTYTEGQAALGAAQDLKAKLLGLAADLLEWPADRVTLEAGRVMLTGEPSSALALGELASRAITVTGQPIVGKCRFRGTGSEVTGFCAQVAEVEVDAETGQVRLLRFVTAHDVGTIVNPLHHQGQIEGGVIQGVGYALMEQLDSEQGRVSTLNLGDYKVPTINDVPELTTVLVGGPSGTGPYQGKGIGENSIAPVAPAIANAVEDAVGVSLTDLPITAEKVLRALKAKKGKEQ